MNEREEKERGREIETERQTNGQTDRQIDGQRYAETVRNSLRKMDGNEGDRDKQTDK